MFITQDWCFTHMPKTAGKWVCQSLAVACLMDKKDHFHVDNHRGRAVAVSLFNRADIPIVGCRRHPCDWYVSVYEYSDLARAIPFSEYLLRTLDGNDGWMMPHTKQDARAIRRWGCYSMYMWNFFGQKSPDEYPNTLDDFRAGVKDVFFLRQWNMRYDMQLFLSDRWFSVAAMQAAIGHEDINVTPTRAKRPWQEYFTKSDLEVVMNAEGFAFDTWSDFMEMMPT